MLRLVTFDLDGTLYSNKRFYPQLIWRWFRGAFAGAPLTTIRGAFAARAFQKAREELRASGQLLDLRSEQFARAAERAGCPEAMVREVIDALIYENDFEGASGHLFPGVLETLKAFQQRRLKLAVLSDYPVERKLKALGLDAVNWDLLLSAEDVNALKPHPAIFTTACERLGVSPGEALHVGDRPECDVAGAQAAGMKSLLFTGEGLPKCPEPKADYQASDYARVRVIVEALLG